MSTTPDLDSANRMILWNLDSKFNEVLMYALFVLSVVVCAWGLWRRVELWSLGQPDESKFKQIKRRFKIAYEQVFKQRRTNSEKEPALFHSLLYVGFLALLFTTTMVLIDHDLGIKIYNGKYYLAVTILSDILGVGYIAGVLIAFHRRYIVAPDRLHSTNADFFFLFLLAALGIQGYLLEGLRIYVTNDPWRAYSPVGDFVAKLCWFLPIASAKWLHFITWWIHALTVFVGIALLPYSKLFHLFASSANLFFQELDKPKGAMKHVGDIEELMAAAMEREDGEFKVGVSTAEDMTWKQRLDVDACTSCGRCQDVCPAYNTSKMLSPKWMVLDTRDHLLRLSNKHPENQSQGFRKKFPIFRALDLVDAALLELLILPTDFKRANNPKVQSEARLNPGESERQKLAGEVINPEVYWSCVTCRACVEVCPVGIEHVDLITDVRRSLTLMEGDIPQEAQPILKAIETRDNPLGPKDERANWSQGLDVRILNEGDEVQVLYWVGCISAYDKRKQSIARSMVKILNASGLSWGILGEKECCTGDPARRIGEENLFQAQVKKNVPTLKSIKFKTLVANCPHCFNSIKNEYPQFGDKWDFDVVHHTHFINHLLDTKVIVPTNTAHLNITYHDPCYLGRYNDTYDEPRETLVQIGGRKLKEMSANRERGMCCGAGGGHYWFDLKVGERINSKRVDQAHDTGANVIATGCPFCMQMMEDGVKLTNREDSMVVRDIAELVAESL